MVTKNSPKTRQDFYCKKCDYVCSKKSDYDKHLLTAKHKKVIMVTKNSPKLAKPFMCSCGKSYKHLSGLCRHKKICNYEVENEELEENKNDESPPSINDMFIQMMKKNNELQDILLERSKKEDEYKMELHNYVKNGSQVINNTQNTQNNNFNMNFFLNEQCKNAMNISDFLKTVQVDIEDVANVGKLGYVEGISRIFTNALKVLDVYERPIHCSDLKREVLYVKENGIWEKEGEDKSSMKKALQIISHRNVMKIKGWTDANPSWKTHYSKEEDEYLKISYESMGGSNAEEDDKYFNKIIRKIASNVTINKEKI